MLDQVQQVPMYVKIIIITKGMLAFINTKALAKEKLSNDTIALMATSTGILDSFSSFHK